MSALAPYVKVGDTVITSYLRNGGPKPSPPSRRIKDTPILGTHRVALSDNGREALAYEVTCSFLPSQYASYDTVAGAFENLEEGGLFYPRSDRFAICKYGASDPLQSNTDAREGEMLRLEGRVWCEAAELYDASSDEWDVIEIFFPYTQIVGFTNTGSIKAGLYALTINAGAGLDSLVMQFLSGATVVSTINITPKLMEDEELVIDRFGQITQTYADAFAANKFSEDAYSYSSAVVSGGALVISTSGYAIYSLSGEFPIETGGLLVTFTPTLSGGGAATFDVSTDNGVTWDTVTSSATWVNGKETVVHIPHAEGYVIVWIRWAVDAVATSLSLDDLGIVQHRYIADSVIPKIPVGSTYKVKFMADEDADAYIFLTTEVGDTLDTEAGEDLYWPNNENLSILATWRNRYIP